MLERIQGLLISLVLFSLALLVSCSSIGDTAGSRKPPVPPEGIQVRVGDQGLEVSWKSVPGATHYTLFWGPDSGQYKNLTNSPKCQALISGLNKGDMYYVAVTSWNARGESNYSQEQTVVYDDNPARAGVHLAQGQRAMKRGLNAEAHAYFSAAIRLDPENAEAYQCRAVLYEMINESELARRDHQTAEKLYKKQLASTKVSSN